MTFHGSCPSIHLTSCIDPINGVGQEQRGGKRFSYHKSTTLAHLENLAEAAKLRLALIGGSRFQANQRSGTRNSFMRLLSFSVLHSPPISNCEFPACLHRVCRCRPCGRAACREDTVGVGGAGAQTRHAVDDVDDQVEAVEIIQHHHVERRRGRPFFLVPANVQLMVIGPAIRQAMDQPGIAVEGEDDRLVPGEQDIEILVAQAVRMLALRLQASSSPPR